LGAGLCGPVTRFDNWSGSGILDVKVTAIDASSASDEQAALSGQTSQEDGVFHAGSMPQ
jgi:hypothetical protein